MKPTDYIKYLTGQLLYQSGAELDKLTRDYKSSEDTSRANLDRFRVKKYLKDCLKVYSENKE